VFHHTRLKAPHLEGTSPNQVQPRGIKETAPRWQGINPNQAQTLGINPKAPKQEGTSPKQVEPWGISPRALLRTVRKGFLPGSPLNPR
jgi:hypothetical protein